MLTKANSEMRVVCDQDGKIVGYGLLLFHKGTSLARLYSIATDPSLRGKGVASNLLDDLEKIAVNNGCAYLRLEVRTDNLSAIKLYEKRGHKRFDHKLDYYDDHSSAYCYEKKLTQTHDPSRKFVPFYSQKTDFTCGPASLMMAMAAINCDLKLNQRLELQLWREATTIFMTSGHGGCGPRGLALAAYKRGYFVEVYLSHDGPLFTKGVRDAHKKAVVELVHFDFKEQIKETDIKIFITNYTFTNLREILDRNGFPVVLISTYRLNKNKSPHWVTVVGIDDHFIFFHDPEVNWEGQRTQADSMYIPVTFKEFEKMSRFGGQELRSCVAVFPR